MRRFDKSNNIRKANLLVEERYLISKGFLKEEEEEATPSKRKIVVLVGPPSVGKSTWTKSRFTN